MENTHSIAVALEHIFHLPYQSANEIEKDPFSYFKSFLDEAYEKSSEKATMIDQFDNKYGKYKGIPFAEWEGDDPKDFYNELVDIVKH